MAKYLRYFFEVPEYEILWIKSEKNHTGLGKIWFFSCLKSSENLSLGRKWLEITVWNTIGWSFEQKSHKF